MDADEDRRRLARPGVEVLRLGAAVDDDAVDAAELGVNLGRDGAGDLADAIVLFRCLVEELRGDAARDDALVEVAPGLDLAVDGLADL